MKKGLFLFGFALFISGAANLVFAEGGVMKKRIRPHLYGRVIIDNFSSSSGLAPVAFEHWVHRSKATCRLCHIDLGFAMVPGGTEMRAADNMRGYYCGSCHNGKTQIGNRAVFAACTEATDAGAVERCQRCHNNGDKPKLERQFRAFASQMPRERLGNGIDWEQAESEKIIQPIDYLEGISIKGPGLKVVDDFTLESKLSGMPDIIFSHEKHTAWNGCEVCHPEIFMGVKRGSTEYSMIELFQGKYCGVCHDRVAFPQTDCRRCHTKSVM